MSCAENKFAELATGGRADTLSVQRLMCSEVKKGSCLRYESLDHMAWVTIWASSMAARAGLSQPLLDSTSTQAWIRRIACKGKKQKQAGRQQLRRPTGGEKDGREVRPC